MDPRGYRPLDWPPSVGGTPDCSTWNKSSCQNENQGTGSSPVWGSVCEKSMDDLRSLGGVPVLRRPSSNPISFNDDDSPSAAASPDRPQDCWLEPTCIRPLRNVPVVTTTVPARNWTSR